MLAKAPRLLVPKTSKHIVRNLREAQVKWDEPLYTQRFPRPKRGRRAVGFQFEATVARALNGRYPTFIDSLPIAFSDASGPRTVVPDGLLFLPEAIVVLEVKLSHTVRAFWEMKLTYAPLLEKAFRKAIRMLEVTKNYDPKDPFPVPTMITTKLDEFLSSKAQTGVLLWR